MEREKFLKKEKLQIFNLNILIPKKSYHRIQ